MQSKHQSSTKPALPLTVSEMALHGRHIIEASAGTGKTYNITRIFIRLLLVKQVAVQKVLIVTFTKAATEELRGRIAQEVNQLLLTLTNDPAKLDAGFVDIIKQIPIVQGTSSDAETKLNNDYEQQLQSAKALLKVAALDLDDASIFTIHGFCQRVIKQSAFLRQQSFAPEIVASSQQYVMQEVQDWFRRHQNNTDSLQALSFLGVANPDAFFETYKNALYGYTPLCLADADLVSDKLVPDNEGIDNKIFDNDSSEKPSPDNNSLEIPNKEALRAKIDTINQSLLSAENELLNSSQGLAITELFSTRASYIRDVLAPTKRQSFDKLLAYLLSPSQDKPNKTDLSKLFIAKEYKAMTQGLPNDAELIKQLSEFYAGLIALLGTEKTAKDDIKQVNEAFKKAQTASADKVAYSIILEIKNKVAALKQKREVIDHDDTIHSLASSVQQGNQALIDYVQGQYPYALIDEFQDTDKDQYSIFSSCYPASHSELMLLMIGDPKQAIYGFRGGDINTYIAAREHADFIWTMQHNYRSSQAMIDAYNVLFYGVKIAGTNLEQIKRSLPKLQQDQRFDAQEEASNPIADALLFDQDIPYPWIYPGKALAETLSDSHASNESHTNNGGIHFQLISDLYPKPPDGRKGYKDEQAHAVAMEIDRLSKQARINDEALAFKDIAVLVSSASQAQKVQAALNQLGLKSVYLSEKTDIFASEQALALFYALDGILHGNHNQSFFRALSTDLFGVSPDTLLAMQHDIALFDEYKERVHELKKVWARDGILVMITTLLKNHFCARNQQTSKERILTNYMHLAELLNTQSAASEHAYQLLNWLKKQLPQNDATADEDGERENAQRLESDEELVKIVTLHGSKGLEYPIVFIPYAGFKAYKPPKERVLRYYDPITQQMQVQIGTSESASMLEAEQTSAEQIRLLYVGITRAIHRCYLGIGKKSEFTGSALYSLLRHQGIEDPSDQLTAMVNSDGDLFALDTYTLEGLEESQRHSHNVHTAKTAKTANASAPKPSDASSGELSSSLFTGNTGQVWQVESFSKISRQQTYVDLAAKDRDEDEDKSATSAETGLASNGESGQESSLESKNANTPIGMTYPATPERGSAEGVKGVKGDLDYRFSIEKSADTGNLLHNILEDHDFTQPLALNDNNPHIRFYNNGLRTCDSQQLSRWLTQVLNTPMPSLHGQKSFSLSNLAQSHTLKEPEFYFPLKGVSARDLHHLLRVHRSEMAGNQDAVVPFFTLSDLSGMMHGFIDLLFMHEGKYYVADYKSNFLGASQDDYQGPQMRHAIQSHNYDLQYLIYCWALDKYLQARLPNYNRKADFGGVYYLFLRGMSPDFSPGTGIYTAGISDALWAALEAVFAAKDFNKTEHSYSPEQGGVV